jgi:hypothetical protein
MQKRVNHKAQAAMEFLMTYGWAILVVLVAIGALAYFGVLNPSKFLPNSCTLEPGIGCIDHQIKDTFVTLVIQNGKGQTITISNINIIGCTGSATGTLSDGKQETFIVSGCNLTTNSRYSEEISITYTVESGIEHVMKGDLTGKIEQSNTTINTIDFTVLDDTEISLSNPDTNYGSATELQIDGFAPHAHSVLKFLNMFGEGVGQIPLGTQIDSATLKVDCTSTAVSAPNIYLLIEDWVESEATWNERSNGVTWSNAGADGLNSHAASPVVQWDCQWPLGFKNFDMTPFVQSWSDGTPNYGVVGIDTGSDGLNFHTSEYSTPENRPILNVVFTVYE